jgi:hypothetical protein
MLILHTRDFIEDYDKAAAQCPIILGSDAELWEHWIYAFAEARQLKVLFLTLGGSFEQKAICSAYIA